MTEQNDNNQAVDGPKWQHYVPCCYLKHFAHVGVMEGRKTKVFYTDGRISELRIVKRLAAEDYFYSELTPAFDFEFNNMENDYPLIVKKIMNGETLSKKQYYQFIITMGDFNLRNVAYENQTDRERKDVYTAISKAFNEDMFGEVEGRGADLQAMMDWLSANLRLQPFRSESGEKFITSDNPSTIFSHPRSGRPVMIYLPIHPDYAAVAYDQRHLDVVGNEISDDALGVLNGIQINRCVQHVFSDHDILNGEDQESAEKLKALLEREKPRRYITQDGAWVRDFIPTSQPVFGRLTFMKKPDNPILRNAVRQAISEMQSESKFIGL